MVISSIFIIQKGTSNVERRSEMKKIKKEIRTKQQYEIQDNRGGMDDRRP